MVKRSIKTIVENEKCHEYLAATPTRTRLHSDLCCVGLQKCSELFQAKPQTNTTPLLGRRPAGILPLAGFEWLQESSLPTSVTSINAIFEAPKGTWYVFGVRTSSSRKHLQVAHSANTTIIDLQRKMLTTSSWLERRSTKR